jgi:hypothetical protein
VTHGAFGKICYGISSDWQVHVVKVFRLGDQLCRISGKKTFTLPRQRAVDELSLTVFVRNLIDREWARHQARAPGGRSPYDSLRRKCVPFELIDLKSARFARPDGADVHKLYAVMTRETGNLVDLRRNLLPTSYVPAALSLAAQVFAELAIMHGKARYAHLDISQGNVLFNGHGQFKLMDFGLAQALANGSTGCKGLWGTLAAPEMVAKICDGVLSADITAVPELTAAVDVFTLGALIAQFASGYAWNLNPFHIPPAHPGDEPGARQASLWRAFVRFELWKDAHRQAPTQDVRLERIRNGEQGTFNHFFFNLAAGCPPLCELLLNRVLVLDPRGRASAAQVDLMLRHMLPDAEDLDMKMLRAAMHRVDKRQAMEVLQHKAQKFADQIKQVVDPSCRDEGNVDERQPSP